jgi:hypothetical protein
MYYDLVVYVMQLEKEIKELKGEWRWMLKD